ncbi:putative YT521-B-like splicing factor [Aspergillus aculeatinus CBS 121060]|uniref:Uncharacterized protein n=1 Tax=Aspergillus aculeatinus CBS 121060 TaxID=1448322 RepID=A0ACD1H6I2_9EURO|nr:hypothetical protein BO66DRAFT_120210 [Aspergillus aculeatinus CBS 121060]RAH69022.1 hypothetical protein BO66DRAFT_120210 [Aspergillus aculeatinus CBS 121060]
MPNSSDCAPMAQSNATLEVADVTKPPASSGKGNEAEIAYRPPGSSRFSQAAQTDNKHSHSDGHAYASFCAPGNLHSDSNISGSRSVLPAYQLHPILYEQHPMQQQFIPTVLPHGVVYPIHALSSYAPATMNANMAFGAPFPFYAPYVQQHQQHQQQDPNVQHSNPGYQPLAPNSSSHLKVHTPSQAPYSQGYYPQTSSATAPKPSPAPPSMSVSNHRPLRGHIVKTATDLDRESRHSNTDYDVSKTIVDGSTPMRSHHSSTDAASRSSQSPGPNTLRGPLRKPKQSGHALWVGNLPPATNIMDLKDHFSQEATKELVSVFLISKSNCAFINYKTAAACAAALSRFNDSRFHGARLVCRLRHGTILASSSHEAIGSATPSPSQDQSDSKQLMINDDTESVAYRKFGYNRRSSARMTSRYFVVKSLTVEDLEHSRQTNIWATQTHNEDQLNQAYENADDVYLIFSANKSGEYYGYARMMSPIQDDERLAIEVPPRPNNMPNLEEPDITPTPATSTAAKGRVINDSIRGTIFWEAESSEDEGDMKADRAGTQTEDTSGLSPQLIGKPFRIRWLSGTRVPFHRTRGLRNPWNANREVKIARDGTEIEPGVGWKLVQLFHSNAQE